MAKIDPVIKYQWKKGESGNPLGRPKGSRNITSQLKEMLDLEIQGKDPVSGEDIIAPAATFINARMIKNALNGDQKAIREIYDRIEGRPKQKLDVTGDVKVKGFLNACMSKAVKGPK